VFPEDFSEGFSEAFGRPALRADDDSAEIGNTMSEIVGYGTAAVIEPASCPTCTRLFV
jgi:hypothetical protein